MMEHVSIHRALISWLFVGIGLCLVSCEKLPTATPLSVYDDQVHIFLDQMTLDEKIGQMIQADQEHLESPNDIETYFLGSLLNSGDSDPAAGNTLKDWTDMVDGYQRHAVRTRLRIPLLYGTDAVHGHNNVLGAVIFPHNIALGCTRDRELVARVGRVTAEEMRATGIQWTFAPCVAVPRDERWGRTYEGFSEDPDLVARLTEVAVWGIQGPNLTSPLAVAACAKHYIGDGGTEAVAFNRDPRLRRRPRLENAPQERVFVRLDQGNVNADEQTLRRLYLEPYRAAIRAGVCTIMPSYSSWNGVKCSASKRLLTEILKDELGFEGFLISDYRAINQVHPDYKTAIGLCVNAGMDMGMIGGRYQEFARYLKELVEEGVVPMSRIDDAVTRILRVKCAMGLLSPDHVPLADRTLWRSFGGREHREVARRAVRESLVLLKNEHRTLPLAKTLKRIHVAGDAADNMGKQCGGWTIRWQGRNGDVTLGGTTILQGIQRAVSRDTKVTYTPDGMDAIGADVGVVVVGERPYAEGVGDNGNLTLSDADIRVMDNMKQAHIPLVVILLSGRPLIINTTLERSDAFIAAWLPGTQGEGVADVLFGDYKPQGKLSYTWPRSIDQVPINKGDKPYDPLFKIGEGLSY